MKDIATKIGPFRVLVYPEGEHVIIQGIDYDIAVQGPNQEESTNRFWRTIVGEITVGLQEKAAPLDFHSKVPERFLTRYHNAMGAEKISELNEKEVLFFAHKFAGALSAIFAFLGSDRDSECKSCQAADGVMCPKHEEPIFKNAAALLKAWRAKLG